MIHSLRAEFYKSKRTGLWLTSLLLPIGTLLLFSMLIVLSNQNSFVKIKITLLGTLLTVVLPLALGILTTMSVRLETKDRGIENLLVLPMRKSQPYLSKILFLFTINLIIVAIIAGCFFCFTFLLDADDSAFSLSEELYRFGLVWLGCCLVVSVQFCLSAFIKGILIPLGINFVFSLSGYLVAASKYANYDFWAYPYLFAFAGRAHLLMLTGISLFFTVFFSYLGMIRLQRRGSIPHNP